MQDVMLKTASGGDVADLYDQMASLQSVMSDVQGAIEEKVTYRGWLSVDDSPPPPGS